MSRLRSVFALWSGNRSSASGRPSAIPFQCPHCGLETCVAPQYAGKSGPCASCGKTITVPAMALPTEKRAPRERMPRWLRVSLGVAATTLIVFIVVSIVTWWVRPSIVAARNAVTEARCRQQLETIVAAIRAYERDEGHLPPAYTTDKSGTPLHSWRVLILPYIDSHAKTLYGQIDLDEPWNSPQNSRFHSQLPDVYVCDADQPLGRGDTSYCAVIGRDSAMYQDQARRLSEIKDPHAVTLVVVETAKSGINWMQPRDISTQQLSRGISVAQLGHCGSFHSSGATYGAFLDGRARQLSDFAGQDLMSLATIDGNEDTSFLADR